jgi:hypothetical protein
MKQITSPAMCESNSLPSDSIESAPQKRKNWTPPIVTELPKLSEITLQSGGIPGGGGTGGGGSTVVP